jgi:hypothetical protein
MNREMIQSKKNESKKARYIPKATWFIKGRFV